MFNRKKLAFALALVASFVLAVLTVALARDEWPMFHHDPALTGISTSSAPGTADLLWIYNTGAPLLSSPAVAGGKLYIGGSNGKLYCLNFNTGAPQWLYATGGAIYSSPAVDEGLVYVLSTDGKFYALDANTGALVWNAVGLGGPWSWSSPAVHDGKVFVGASNGWVHSFDTVTGAPIWSTFVGGSPNGPITVANGKVYSGTHNFDISSPTLVALDEKTGAVRWTYSYTTDHPATVGMINCNGAAVADGDGDGDLEVYFGIVMWGEPDNSAIALDEATGKEIWTQNLNGWSTSTPAVHNGKVFIGSDDGHLYSLDAKTGSYIWAFLTSGSVWSAPAVADGKVFFGSLDHYFYGLVENSGALIWKYDTSTSRIMGSPAVAYGKVYFGNENGKVYAFGPLTVTIDIKPGSYPNSINRGSKGNIPVAILSSLLFDATTVDPRTVVFAGAGALSIGLSPQDINGDGLLDIVLHFSTRDVNLTEEATEACLSGKTYKGKSFEGCDSVRIVK